MKKLTSRWAGRPFVFFNTTETKTCNLQ